jgi:outer membrane protein assembly factor BamD
MTQRSMPMRPLHLLLLLAVLFGATGCESISKLWKKNDVNVTEPVEVIYDKGHEQMTEGRWASAAETFQRLTAQYPYGPYTEQALMEMSYAQFKSGRHDDAVSTIDRFIRTYPTHRNIPYFYYLRGLSNASRNAIFLQRVFSLESSNRDLTTPMQAYNDFSIVVERYPNSRYAADAGVRMIELRNLFAKHELDTGLYYLRRGADVAAIARAKYLIETYPQSIWQNDAVALLAVAYDDLGNEALAADARRVLQQNDPSHPALTGDWPDFPSKFRKLNPFAGEKSGAEHH